MEDSPRSVVDQRRHAYSEDRIFSGEGGLAKNGGTKLCYDEVRSLVSFDVKDIPEGVSPQAFYKALSQAARYGDVTKWRKLDYDDAVVDAQNLVTSHLQGKRRSRIRNMGLVAVLSGLYALSTPIQRVWEYLNTPAPIDHCTPPEIRQAWQNAGLTKGDGTLTVRYDVGDASVGPIKRARVINYLTVLSQQCPDGAENIELLVTGNADQSGSEEVNNALAQQRAQNLADFILETRPNSKVSTDSTGKDLAEGEGEQWRRGNIIPIFR